ncbi:putative carboxylesterase from carbohydrate esterase family gh10, partial [Colletotrichum musicola]
MWVAAAALVVSLAAAVSCVPSPQDLRTDITILRDNDLLDAKSPSANFSALFLGETLSLEEANATCRDLGEQLWSPDSNSTQRLLAILDYQEKNVSAIWIAANDDGRPRAISSTGEESSPDDSESLPALCTHSAPFSNGVAQDSSRRWQVTIHSNNDDVLGFRDRNSFRFHGIRYASKTRRFAYPRLYKGSGGNTSALEFGSPCFQGFGGSEDCHFLNIYTPYISRSRRTDQRLRPVMFWIHGGAFTSGFGSDPLFDGGNLASR